jgi:hypothetical protein
VDDSRQVTQTRKYDVNKQVAGASSLQEYTKRRQEDGEEDLANVTKKYPSN